MNHTFLNTCALMERNCEGNTFRDEGLKICSIQKLEFADFFFNPAIFQIVCNYEVP